MVLYIFVGNGISCGKVIQRFPEQDWNNCVFTQGIELVSEHLDCISLCSTSNTMYVV